jgi:release factor glutamine methyltransferase
MTAGAALAAGAARLRTAGVGAPALDAALLLGDLVGLDRAGLLAHPEIELTADAEAAFDARLDRRAAGICVAYLLGHKEFRGLDFLVTADVLVPRPDSETLVEAGLDWLADRFPPSAAGRRAPRVLDLCAGSGCLGVALAAARPDVDLTLIDVSPAALEVAAANARRLLGSGRPFRPLLSDLFDALPPPGSAGGRFDLILSNPPYVPTAAIAGLAPEVRAEPRLALDGGADGLDLIRRIVGESPARLDAGGRILVESDSEQTAAVAALLETAGFVAVSLYRDLDGRPRVCGGERHG